MSKNLYIESKLFDRLIGNFSDKQILDIYLKNNLYDESYKLVNYVTDEYISKYPEIKNMNDELLKEYFSNNYDVILQELVLYNPLFRSILIRDAKKSRTFVDYIFDKCKKN